MISMQPIHLGGLSKYQEACGMDKKAIAMILVTRIAAGLLNAHNKGNPASEDSVTHGKWIAELAQEIGLEDAKAPSPTIQILQRRTTLFPWRRPWG